MSPALPRSCRPCVLTNCTSTIEGLTEAVDDFESVFDGEFGLGDDEVVLFAEDGPAFGVAQDDPLKTNVLKVLGADLAGVGAEVVVRGVLGGHPPVVLVVGIEGQHSGDVEEHWRDDDV